jgi:hypothetical protein
VVVEEEAVLQVPSRDVNHRDAVEGIAPEHGERVAALVEGVRVEVAEVEEQRAPGGARDLAVEVLLAHRVVGPARRPRDVLEGEGDVGEVPPRALDVARHHRHRLARPRELREVPHLPPAGAGERDVLGHQRRLQRPGELAETARAVVVDARRAPERELHPVRNHGPRLGDRHRLPPRALLREAQLRHHLDEANRLTTLPQIAGELLPPPDAHACDFATHGRSPRQRTTARAGVASVRSSQIRSMVAP